MIQCHTFNCFARPQARQDGAYTLSQFVGGMAAVLFLFLAGITYAFQMHSLEQRGVRAAQRLTALLRRAGYVFGVGMLFRISNWVFSPSRSAWRSIFKVDILNCMGAAMGLVAVITLWRGAARARAAAVAAGLVAAAAPIVSGIDWSGVPWLLRDYLQPNPRLFPLFPWAAYLAAGVAAGTTIRRTAPEQFERVMQWAILGGLGLVLAGEYLANNPYSLYERSRFWVDSPTLVVIRTGVCLLALAAGWLCTRWAAGRGWKWMQTLGKQSLLVYWVHVMLVYGWLFEPWKKALSIPQTAAAAAAVIAAMVALAGWRTGRQRVTPPRTIVQTIAEGVRS